VESWLSDAPALARDALAGRGSERELRPQRLRLATDAVEIDALAGHLSYDRVADARTISGLQMLRRHMMMLLPLLASITDRLSALGGRFRQARPALGQLLDRLAQWLATDVDERQPAEQLRAAIAELRPTLGADASWNEIVLANLLIRLRELVDISRTAARWSAPSRTVATLRRLRSPSSRKRVPRRRGTATMRWRCGRRPVLSQRS